MKKEWTLPVLEVLEIKMTMKYWPPVHPPGGGGHPHPHPGTDS
ncbi:paeninodin family lasso peptide [Cohnella sp. 56]